MATKKESFNPIRSGADPRKDAEGANSWLKLEPNQTVDVVALVDVDDIISCEQCAIWLEDGASPVWVYTGPEDPSHDLGVDRRYRAYLPMLVEGEVKVWSMGKGAHGQLLDIADAGGYLKGMEIRIKRTGSGLATRYSVVPKGKRKDVSKIEEVDVISMLGPITPEEVREMIAQRLNLDSYEDVLEKYQGKKIRRSAPKRTEKSTKTGKAAAPVRGKHVSTTDEDEEEDEEEDISLD